MENFTNSIDTNITFYGLTIIILLCIVIACIGCLFIAFVGGSFGYKMARKSDIENHVKLNKDCQRFV